MALRVLIAGGGLGGLTLAHGLRSAGLDVAVFERHLSPPNPATSYRIHIDATGSRALHACLPPHLWDTFVQHSAAPPTGVAFATEHLRVLTRILQPVATSDALARSHPISRAGLRQLLLSGLEDIVSTEKRLVRYAHTSDGQVTAHFADGTTATGDVLVGADGSTSAVRRQLLPHARVVDTGISGIAGKLYLTDQIRERLPGELLSQMNMLLPWRDLGMFLAAFQRQPGRPSSDNLDLPDHLFWVLIGKPGALGLHPTTRNQPGSELQRLALARVERWHPCVPWLVGESDVESLVSVPLSTSQRVAAWPTTTVTLLGDAIHTMPPLQGLGGNTALRDAAVLCHALVEADRGQTPLIPGIHAYEMAMLDYGFEAVDRSVQASAGITSSNLLTRLAFRSVLRVADRVPRVHRLLFERPAPAFPFEATLEA